MTRSSGSTTRNGTCRCRLCILKRRPGALTYERSVSSWRGVLALYTRSSQLQASACRMLHSQQIGMCLGIRSIVPSSVSAVR